MLLHVPLPKPHPLHIRSSAAPLRPPPPHQISLNPHNPNLGPPCLHWYIRASPAFPPLLNSPFHPFQNIPSSSPSRPLITTNRNHVQAIHRRRNRQAQDRRNRHAHHHRQRGLRCHSFVFPFPPYCARSGYYGRLANSFGAQQSSSMSTPVERGSCSVSSARTRASSSGRFVRRFLLLLFQASAVEARPTGFARCVPIRHTTRRALYYFEGKGMRADGKIVSRRVDHEEVRRQVEDWCCCAGGEALEELCWCTGREAVGWRRSICDTIRTIERAVCFQGLGVALRTCADECLEQRYVVQGSCECGEMFRHRATRQGVLCGLGSREMSSMSFVLELGRATQARAI